MFMRSLAKKKPFRLDKIIGREMLNVWDTRIEVEEWRTKIQLRRSKQRMSYNSNNEFYEENNKNSVSVDKVFEDR